jgi:hypothetical protein
MAVTVQSATFWDVRPCSMVEVYNCSSEKSVNFY